MSHTINDLRAVLFDTLHAVKTGTMEIDRAKTVSDIAQTIINSAKLEVDYAKATGADVGSQFIEQPRIKATGIPPANPGIAGQLKSACGG